MFLKKHGEQVKKKDGRPKRKRRRKTDQTLRLTKILGQMNKVCFIPVSDDLSDRFFLENKKRTASVESDPFENVPQIDESNVESFSDQVSYDL